MNAPFLWLQHSVPQHALSRLTGWLAELERPRWLKHAVIRAFVRHYGVDLDEAARPFPEAYASFNDFFTRALAPGVRPLADAALVSPVDGAVSQSGAIDGDHIFQAKGRGFSLPALLGGDQERAARYRGGSFATLYLSPRDYHRVHMPCDGRLQAMRYVPGRLFSVNAATAAGVDGLFARNERLVCHFEGPIGPFALVLVGAMIVAGIETPWAGRVAPAPRRNTLTDYTAPPAPVNLARGEEMGRFYLGSTVILLFPPETIGWDSACAPGARVRLGMALGHRP
ncbi:archaetidylserine decarboxylase [Pseudohaliea rubra]|uniref:Phosphatidylserine decarboxylase proenzyme n=1 Tax=Pseudohaliea rubra DSM 19751 TaxID=1265313 RepID=A0A095WYQ0_9GAMM|nr:archaetidylserine decarboxylase [Pseudohaliea rubra]KGE03749.1 Phosphatidylserine decarboxylase [Pseudohaliea rubra DSM 19751]